MRTHTYTPKHAVTYPISFVAQEKPDQTAAHVFILPFFLETLSTVSAIVQI